MEKLLRKRGRLGSSDPAKFLTWGTLWLCHPLKASKTSEHLKQHFFSSGCESCQKEQVLPPRCVPLWGKSQQQTAFLSCAALTPASLSLDGGDKDARDSVQMWLEQRLRDGLEDGSVSGQQIGTFERYTKVSFGLWGQCSEGVGLGGGGFWGMQMGFVHQL